MRVRFAAAAAIVALASLTACAGGTLNVERPLADVAPVEVHGPTFMAACAGPRSGRANEATSVELLAASAPTVSTMGGATLTLGAVQLGTKMTREARASVLADLVTHLAPPGQSPDARARDAMIAASADEAMLDGLLGAATSTERAAFPFVVAREGRLTAGLCASAVTANLGHPFERPLATVICTLAREGGDARRLEVHGAGGALDMTFVGALTRRGATPSPRWNIASQSIEVFGVGVVRGFDLRGADGAQIGALDLHAGEGAIDAPGAAPAGKAWFSPLASADDGDALVATLLLLRAQPWPSLCDAGILQARHATPH